MRIDKFLWAVRLFKTRNLAAESCKKEKILIDNQAVKSAKEVKQGYQVQVWEQVIWRTYLVKLIPLNRVGAAQVSTYIQELTLSEDLTKLNEFKAERRFYLDR